MSLEATLGAGTIVRFSTNLQTPSYTVIPGVLTFGSVGNMSEGKDSTVLANKVKRSRPGMEEGEEKSIKGQYWSEDTDQKAFATACRARLPMLIQVEFDDNSVEGLAGTIAEYEYQPYGFEIDEPTAEEWLMFTVNGKRNGPVSITDPATA